MLKLAAGDRSKFTKLYFVEKKLYIFDLDDLEFSGYQ